MEELGEPLDGHAPFEEVELPESIINVIGVIAALLIIYLLIGEYTSLPIGDLLLGFILGLSSMLFIHERPTFYRSATVRI